MDKNKFMESVSASTHKACEHGRVMAIHHYREISNASESEAEAMYLAVKAAVEDGLLAVQVKNDDVEKVLLAKRYAVLAAGYNNVRHQCEALMGCAGLRPIYAEYKAANAPKDGYCLLVLSGNIDAVVFNGDPMRVRNPERPGFVPDPSLLLYSAEHVADCNASSMICGMSIADASVGSDRLLERIVDGEFDTGCCPVLILSDVGSENLRSIVASADLDAIPIRKTLASIELLVPVLVSGGKVPIIGTDMHAESDDKIPVSAKTGYLKAGDRVALKPLPSQPKLLGKILEATGALVSVRWDNGTKGIYDAAEALMRLMPAPVTELCPKTNADIQGMSQESRDVLSRVGVDPETLYALMSHFMPSTASSQGWASKIASGLMRFGLAAKEVEGFRPGKDSFERSKWIEASLPNGDRLIIDMAPGRIFIEAGDADDYILPATAPMVELE